MTRTVLMCHAGALLDRTVLPGWIASWSELAGVIVIEEPKRTMLRRVRRQLTRVGPLRFLDVLAFRAAYRLVSSKRDSRFEAITAEELGKRYPAPDGVPQLVTRSANSSECRDFLQRTAPDILIARCKSLLKEEIFSIPSLGTFVLHPGICPEYRNSHGCFWAIVRNDYERVGLTVLKIDSGVDTGPIYGYLHAPFDPLRESHIRIQQRLLFENLEPLAEIFRSIAAGNAEPLDVTGRESAAWGQPWLSAYIKWRMGAGR